MWYLIVSMPDLCTLSYFDHEVSQLHIVDQSAAPNIKSNKTPGRQIKQSNQLSLGTSSR